MADWKETHIHEFLKERVGRYKPNDPTVSKLKRLDKIDFSGGMHFSDKSSKTDMIIAKKGDLVISGINVAKGALAVYSGDVDITATIHYSSYQFDDEKINVEYFKRFLKSPKFIQLLKDQVKGGIKTEIKPKHLLPLKIGLPDINTQKSIVDFFKRTENDISDVSTEITLQQSLLKKLRQAILQEAVEGKLTAGWRKQNPELISGENHAARLLEKIKAEKERLVKEGKIKKQKPLPPISEDEKPFDLPEGWVWCRLGDVINFTENFNIHSKLNPDQIIHYIDIDAVDNKNFKIKEPKILPVSKLSSRARRVLKSGFIVYSLVRPYLNNLAILSNDYEFYIGSTGFAVFKGVKVLNKYLFHFLLTTYIRNHFLELLSSFNSPSITHDQFSNTIFSLPPLAEQQAIVEKVDRLMAKIDALEEQVKSRKEQAEQLMQAVLREAFNGG